MLHIVNVLYVKNKNSSGYVGTHLQSQHFGSGGRRKTRPTSATKEVQNQPGLKDTVFKMTTTELANLGSIFRTRTMKRKN